MRIEYIDRAEAFPQDWQAAASLEAARAAVGDDKVGAALQEAALQQAYAVSAMKATPITAVHTLYTHVARLDRRILDEQEQDRYFRFAGELLTRTQLLFLHGGIKPQYDSELDGSFHTYKTSSLYLGTADSSPDSGLYARGSIVTYSHTPPKRNRPTSEYTHDIQQLSLTVSEADFRKAHMRARLLYPSLSTLNEYHDHENERADIYGKVPELPYVTGYSIAEALAYARVLDFVEGRLGVVKEVGEYPLS